MQVHRATPELAALGARVAIIGNGPPRFVADFRRTTEYEGELFTDPSREVYRACGFVRGVGATLNLTSLGSGLRAFSAGFRQGRTQGDPWQQGGAIIIDRGGEVIAFQRSERAGDHAKMSALIAALEEHAAMASA